MGRLLSASEPTGLRISCCRWRAGRWRFGAAPARSACRLERGADSLDGRLGDFWPPGHGVAGWKRVQYRQSPRHGQGAARGCRSRSLPETGRIPAPNRGACGAVGGRRNAPRAAGLDRAIRRLRAGPSWEAVARKSHSLMGAGRAARQRSVIIPHFICMDRLACCPANCPRRLPLRPAAP